MNKDEAPHGGAWQQPSPRAEMLQEVRALQGKARSDRLAIPHGKPGHIDDEVVATLALTAWRAREPHEGYASALLQRVARHVKAHVRKNPGWQRLGGGQAAATDDFTQAIVLSIYTDQLNPCHAEVAFGDYVYKRALDQAGKLFAKKNSAGQTLDEGVEAQEGDTAVSPASHASPEEVLSRWQQEKEEEARLRRILEIVQGDTLPELAKIAFTFRFYGEIQIDSKKDDVVTIVRLMGRTEKTVTKYINEAITLIQQELEK